MTRSEVRKILLRYRGSLAEVANEIGVNRNFVTWALKGYRGRMSFEREQMILTACERKANSLLLQEGAA